MSEVVDELIGITEENKSAPVAFWAYNPEEREAVVLYSTGVAYKYLNVSGELAKLLREKAIRPKTSGKNEYGEWSPEDEKSLGATLSALIHNDPMYKKPKKGEPPNPNYKRLDTEYDRHKELRIPSIRARKKSKGKE